MQFFPPPSRDSQKTRRPLDKTVIVYRPVHGPCSTVCEIVSNIEQPSLRIEWQEEEEEEKEEFAYKFPI